MLDYRHSEGRRPGRIRTLASQRSRAIQQKYFAFAQGHCAMETTHTLFLLSGVCNHVLRLSQHSHVFRLHDLLFIEFAFTSQLLVGCSLSFFFGKRLGAWGSHAIAICDAAGSLGSSQI